MDKTEKKTTADDTTEVWDLEEDEERRREAFEEYCGKSEAELETEEERQRKKEKSDKLKEMRERWEKEERPELERWRGELEKLRRGQ